MSDSNMPSTLDDFQNEEPEYSMYSYSVSEAAAIIFCILFAVSGLIALYQSLKTRAWIWLVMLIAIGGKAETR